MEICKIKITNINCICKIPAKRCYFKNYTTFKIAMKT